ncbi:MAG: phosphatidate cytidylyltransferase [Spirochaetota bacterium]
MRNLYFRILVFIIGIPGLVALVLSGRENSNFAFHLLVVAASALGAWELGRLFEKRIAAYRGSVVLLPVMGAAPPVVAMLLIHSGFSPELFSGVMVAILGAILAAQAFRRNENDFDAILPAVSAHAAILIYPGLFLAYVIRISIYPAASELLLVLIGAVYLNDAGAYVAGMLFGKNSRKVLPISPKKSLVGFVFGFLVSPGIILAARAVRPALFPGPVWVALLFGCALGITTILGDLAESALKRSATVKDSGQIIPGRGGILDSIDSPLFAAPVFFYLYAPLFVQ